MKLIEREARGRMPVRHDFQRRKPPQILHGGPIQALHGVLRWRMVDPPERLRDGLKVGIATWPLSGELRAISCR